MKYRKIDLYPGCDIETAVNLLQEHNEKGQMVYCEFNGRELYSDKITLDSAFKLITGKTKAEFDKDQNEYISKSKKSEEAHKKNIPVLTKEWIEKGKEILSEDKWALWEEIVPIRLDDLYRGAELGDCLDIIKILNNNENLDKAKEKIKEQGHSGMSYHLVVTMVKELCNRGEEFSKYLKQED